MIGRFRQGEGRNPFRRREIRFPLIGWLLFMVSAGFFIASSLRNGDPLGLAGALFFLLACFFFLPPLFAEMIGRGVERAEDETDDRVGPGQGPRPKRKTPSLDGEFDAGDSDALSRREEFRADEFGDRTSF